MTRHLEIVTFTTKDGVEEKDLLSAVEESDRFIAAQPGFVSGRLARQADGGWIDIVEWETLETAQAAAEKFFSAPEASRLVEMIAEGAQMQHLPLMHTR